jgi:Helix-turn-helix domain
VEPLKVGAPFNPYRVFQGSFAPYWLLEHRGISAGAKLCYIRLLGFAGKDARCYPSLETLGVSLGVSDRQARDYVKELERQGLIVIEQRGLRKTNVYLFVWTAELEGLMNAVPDDSADPGESENDSPPGSPPDRNDRSGQDRNWSSPPDRNNCSVLDRKYPAGPIGINSAGINSPESSSSSNATEAARTRRRTTQEQSTTAVSAVGITAPNDVAGTIIRWAKERGVQRLRPDRQVGYPDEEHVLQWSQILEQRGITNSERICAVLDAAMSAATRSGEWRNWAFLTLQVQLATERLTIPSPEPAPLATPACDLPDEDPACDWAIAKQKIRNQIREVPFRNWFECTRQLERRGGHITIAVPNEATRFFLEAEYGNHIRAALGEFGVEEIELTVVANESRMFSSTDAEMTTK